MLLLVAALALVVVVVKVKTVVVVLVGQRMTRRLVVLVFLPKEIVVVKDQLQEQVLGVPVGVVEPGLLVQVE
jgi:hypothetical protein